MSRAKRIAVALCLDLLLVVGEAIVSRHSHSSGLLADAAHNLVDAGGLVVALGALSFSQRAPTSTRSFGMHRATILSALFNVALLLVTMALVGAFAIERIVHPLAVQGGVVAITAGIAAVINAAAAYAVVDHSNDLNMRSAFLHLGGDVLASLGVSVAGLIEFSTGHFVLLDPTVALLIALLIGYEALRIARSSVEVLLEAVPADIDVPDLARAMGEIAGVSDVHDLHVWSISSDVRILSAHVVLDGHPSLEEAQATGKVLRELIGARYSIDHATLELECEACEQDDALIWNVERVTTRD